MHNLISKHLLFVGGGGGGVPCAWDGVSLMTPQPWPLLYKNYVTLWPKPQVRALVKVPPPPTAMHIRLAYSTKHTLQT